MADMAKLGERANLYRLIPSEFNKQFKIITDPTDTLYDHRGLYRFEEPVVRDMGIRGVIEPVIVGKRGKEQIVVEGRQRVINATEVERRQREAGVPEGQLIRIPFWFKAGGEKEFLSIMIVANEQRRDDTVLEKARKAVRMLNLTGSRKEVADAFKITQTDLTQWLHLLELDTEVLKAVEQGKASAHAVLEFYGLDPEKQRESLKELLGLTEGSDGKPAPKQRPSARRAKKIAKAKGKQNGGRAWRSRKEINEEIERLQSPRIHSDSNRVKLDTLLWVRGED